MLRLSYRRYAGFGKRIVVECKSWECLISLAWIRYSDSLLADNLLGICDIREPFAWKR